jgi:hypothetical protein
MNGFKNQVDLNVLQLGSYDVLIGMDWLEKYKVVLNFYEIFFTCLDDNGNIINIKGISRTNSVRNILSLQIKRYIQK